MKSNSFVYKYQGAGNDFILIEASSSYSFSKEFVSHICQRHHSIGGDGLLQVFKISSDPFIWGMRIYNSDGKKASMCGNGLRCVAAHLIKTKTSLTRFQIQSDAGLHEILREEPLERCKEKDLYYIKTCFGLVDPLAHQSKIQFLDFSQTKSWLDPRLIEQVYFLDSGVPHLFFLVKRDSIINSNDIRSLGRFWRYHEAFEPQGTNVSVGHLENDKFLWLRTYERGVEEITLSCGTGAVAAASAVLFFQNRISNNQSLQVQFPSQPLMTVTRDEIGHFWLTGPASFSFKAKLSSHALSYL